MEQTVFPRKETKVEYKDFYFRLAACLVASHFLIVYGETMPTFEMMLMAEYYYALVGSTIIALVLFSAIRAINIRLDKKFSWRDYPMQRTGMQTFWSFVIPAVFAFLLAAAYFFVRDVNILETSYLRYDFHIILMQLGFINLYYIAYYFYKQWRAAENELVQYEKLGLYSPGKDQTPDSLTEYPEKPTLLPEIQERESMEQTEPATEATYREIFIVHTTMRSIPVKIKDIASFYRANGCYYLRTVDQSVNDAYIIPQILKDVEKVLDPLLFFRINRKMIVSFSSCVSYRQGKGKTLELVLNPAHVDTEDKMRVLPFVTVSEDRVQAFKAWMDR
ncbi:LytTR family DNA-binding domain-containing protein [Pedobacter nutrimenti]|uniref:LytTR family DNA-binding domain-containing protein n=1 Tax=Pedobacter nutrimenti TaxID=1241337 RepID=UPI0029307088|nr:LytTR family DNA-binding domain-containing protein [Pedobacter nutrimenti]